MGSTERPGTDVQRWAFVTRPRWLVGHALLVVLLVAFITACLWQLGRHNDRRDRNAQIEAAEQQVATPLNISNRELSPDTPAPAEWQHAYVRGRWVHDEAVLVRNRSHNNLPGCHLAVPLEVTSGSTGEQGTGGPDAAPNGVVVVVGWLPAANCVTGGRVPEVVNLAETAVRSSTTQLTGRVRASQERGSIGPTDAAEGRLATLARVDVQRLARQSSLHLAPYYLELVRHTPPLAANQLGLQLIEPPATDSGPHLAYAGQWFLFAVVAVVGYPLVLWRQAHPKPAEELA